MFPSGPVDVTAPWFLRMLLLVVLIGVGLQMAYVNHKTYNPDEPIALAVVQNLSFPRQWDTNWAKTDVTEYFRYDQYNFSSYHYLLYFWKEMLRVLGIDWTQYPWVLRALNGLFGAVFLTAVALTGRRLAGNMAGILPPPPGRLCRCLCRMRITCDVRRC